MLKRCHGNQHGAGPLNSRMYVYDFATAVGADLVAKRATILIPSQATLATQSAAIQMGQED